jgi:hypothetical protein
MHIFIVHKYLHHRYLYYFSALLAIRVVLRPNDVRFRRLTATL